MTNDRLIRTLARDGVIHMGSLLSLLMPESTNVGFGVKGLDGRYRLANHEMQRLLGNGGGIAGRSERELLPPGVLGHVEACDQSLLNSGTATYTEVELPVDGQSRPYLWLKLPILGPSRELQAIASILHEAAPSAASSMQQTLDRLQQANLELRRAVSELEQAAGTDKLTGAWNRRRLEECVRREMDRLNRYGQPLSLLLVDIDHFKTINDEYGHAAGDQALQTVTALLHGKLRGTDALARWGGEEFVVVCPNTLRSTAALLAERLRRLIASTHFPEVGTVTVSIGAAECSPGDTWDQWFQRADEALYQAKRGGRNQVQLAPDCSPHVASDVSVVASFVQLVWDSAYECGNDLVDRGHRQLFAHANELLSAILSDHAAERIDAIVHTLIADVLDHFSAEETVFVAAGYPDAATHIAQHQALIADAHQLLDDYRSSRHGVGDVFQFLAYEVITRHMLGADPLFFPYLGAREPTPAAVGEKQPA